MKQKVKKFFSEMIKSLLTRIFNTLSILFKEYKKSFVYTHQKKIGLIILILFLSTGNFWYNKNVLVDDIEKVTGLKHLTYEDDLRRVWKPTVTVRTKYGEKIVLAIDGNITNRWWLGFKILSISEPCS